MKIIVLFLLILTTAACVSQQESHTKCGSVVCTDEFIMIPVRVIATKSNAIDFKSYKVINMATGKEVKTNGLPGKTDPGTIVVADDARRRSFAERGTTLQLQIVRKDNRIVKADYKISGGPCACHVSKLSGPDQIDLDQ